MKFDAKRFMDGGLAQNACNVGMGDDDLSGYRDVKFEGLMCSAVANTDTGERTFFTVDPKSGEALSSYEVNMPQLYFGIVDAPLEPQVKQKPDVVTVVRYFRRYNVDLCQIESSGGLTVAVVMDYNLGLMQVFPAFCSPEENFVKLIGVEYAELSYDTACGIQFEFDKKLTIRDNLIDALDTNRVKYLTDDPMSIKVMQRGFHLAMNDPATFICGALES